jgi:hypothetical protein
VLGNATPFLAEICVSRVSIYPRVVRRAYEEKYASGVEQAAIDKRPYQWKIP